MLKKPFAQEVLTYYLDKYPAFCTKTQAMQIMKISKEYLEELIHQRQIELVGNKVKLLSIVQCICPSEPKKVYF